MGRDDRPEVHRPGPGHDLATDGERTVGVDSGGGHGIRIVGSPVRPRRAPRKVENRRRQGVEQRDELVELEAARVVLADGFDERGAGDLLQDDDPVAAGREHGGHG